MTDWHKGPVALRVTFRSGETWRLPSIDKWRLVDGMLEAKTRNASMEYYLPDVLKAEVFSDI